MEKRQLYARLGRGRSVEYFEDSADDFEDEEPDILSDYLGQEALRARDLALTIPSGCKRRLLHTNPRALHGNVRCTHYRSATTTCAEFP